MIFDAIIGLLVSLLTGVLGLLPAWSLPGSMSSFGSSVGGALGAANGVFPVVTLGVCLAVLVGAHLFAAGFRLVVWIWEQIPFKAR